MGLLNASGVQHKRQCSRSVWRDKQRKRNVVRLSLHAEQKQSLYFVRKVAAKILYPPDDPATDESGRPMQGLILTEVRARIPLF